VSADSDATATTGTVRPSGQPIKTVAHRHPWSWVLGILLLLPLGMLAHLLATNPAFGWATVRAQVFSATVLDGLWRTLFVAGVALVGGFAVALGLTLMRRSGNPLLRLLSWAYCWFFRALPRIVVVILFGSLGVLYGRLDLGIPFDFWIERRLGLDLDTRYFSFDSATLFSGVVAAILGLTLTQAAYFTEVMRDAFAGTDEAEREAALALGMTPGQARRRAVLPPAMRVLAPAGGREIVRLYADTALVAFVPYPELFGTLRGIGDQTGSPFPMLVAACLWYLATVSILLIGLSVVRQWATRRLEAHR